MKRNINITDNLKPPVAAAAVGAAVAAGDSTGDTHDDLGDIEPDEAWIAKRKVNMNFTKHKQHFKLLNRCTYLPCMLLLKINHNARYNAMFTNIYTWYK